MPVRGGRALLRRSVRLRARDLEISSRIEGVYRLVAVPVGAARDVAVGIVGGGGRHGSRTVRRRLRRAGSAGDTQGSLQAD